MNNNKSLSVIVPAHNAERHLEKCLSAIRSSDFTDYELIVVDDQSTDQSVKIAQRYADKIVSIPKRSNRLDVRLAGFENSKASLIVNIDSDVEIKTDSLKIIFDYFNRHTEIGALTGMLAIEELTPNFFSTYKNLYMNFIFSRLPDTVTFLYGSVFAIRRNTLDLALEALKKRFLYARITDDSEFGQLLISLGVKIGFLRQLEVFHHKIYSFKSLIKNDFMIPRDFARLLVRFKRKPKFSLKTPVFLHTSLFQLIAISSAYLTLSSLLLVPSLCYAFFSVWLLSNLSFFSFLYIKKGIKFTAMSVLFTFIDQITMGIGIIAGFIDRIFCIKRKSSSPIALLPRCHL